MAIVDISVSSVDEDIRNSLRILSSDFFQCLLDTDDTSLRSFTAAWEAFNTTFGKYCDDLAKETVEKVYTFASTVDTVVQGLLDLSGSTHCEKVLEEITQILDQDLANLSLQDVNPSRSDSSIPPYIKPAYEWLLENMHNPYPSKEIRLSIAQKAKASPKDVDSWFIDARKRSGWNDLRKRRFSNKRAAIVDAATRFFVKVDPKRLLEASIESEFAAIQAQTEALYSNKFSESRLAAKLDVTVKDMTPEIKEQLRWEKRQQQRHSRRTTAAQRDAVPYPTPDQSPESSSGSLFPSPGTTISNLPSPSPLSNSKRRKSCTASNVEDDEDEGSNQRRVKRLRIQDHTTAQPTLPSPALSAHTQLDPKPSPVGDTVDIVPPSRKRKRRLSESDNCPGPKRPYNGSAFPRLQTVSDPLPSSALLGSGSFDQWFSEHFLSQSNLSMDIPAAVTVESPDSSSPLEIELFNFGSPRVQLSAPGPSPSPVIEATLVNSVLDTKDDDGNLVQTFTSQHHSYASFDFDNLDATFAPTSEPNLNASPTPALDNLLLMPPLMQLPDAWATTISPFDWNSLDSPSYVSSNAFFVDDTGFMKFSTELTDAVKAEKHRQLQELERKAMAIRAEIAAAS